MSGRSRGGTKRKKQQPAKKKSSNKSKKFDAKAFWGDPEKLPTPEGFETSTPDPLAVVNSLGQPPLPGHGAASPHYFKLVYTRAAQLAGALAMAGEIDDLTPDDPPEPEPEVEEGNAVELPDDVDDTDVDAAKTDSDAANELAEASADEDTPLAEASADEAE